ncbi:MAG: GDCCVxC domain-containing (seleno)protein [Gemmatimonadaceae bacterium]
METPMLQSRLRCPKCGHAEELVMPTDACVFFHACTGCGVLLRPSAGHCCVFCSFGSVPCPSMQAPGASADCCSSVVPDPPGKA